MTISTQTYVLAVAIIGLILVVLCPRSDNGELATDCSGCEDDYNNCMQQARGNSSKLDQCSNTYCAEDCKDCGASTVDCSTAETGCDQSVNIPDTCLAADPNQIYFSNPMCEEDLKELCDDPDAQQQLCSKASTFALDGSTPCCDICKAHDKQSSNDQEQFHSDTSSPPFLYPTDIPQPLGPQGWGYRDPQATYQTLLWDQTRQPLLMPDFNPGVKTGYLDLSVPSAQVQKKQSPFEGTWARPPVPKVRQRPVAHSPYANWATSLRP